ncbi:PepSY domain-containing protein [Bacillus solitudinis]|uniref:PepSY domain-containing protein n=1 Tax=Bacillus solitudinis TaxID=2014074 RepID=UPI000C232285|nr:PepSY domain-containing protein [Bacillus solitudinis]
MAIKRLLLGIGIGLAAGYILRPTISGDKISPEQALKQVKKTLTSTYDIQGSWIHMIPEQLERHQIPYEVYRGGVSIKDESGTLQYEFLVDTKTGTLLELTK